MKQQNAATAPEQQFLTGRRQQRMVLIALMLVGVLLTLWWVQQQRHTVLDNIMAQGGERLELYASTLQAAVARYNPEQLDEGYNIMPDGEEIYFISNPALGLWAERARFTEGDRHEIQSGG